MGVAAWPFAAPLGVNINSRVERVETCRVESVGEREWGSLSRVERADGKKVLLFVSRVQRKKGLVNLVKAWRDVKEWGREGVAKCGSEGVRSGGVGSWRDELELERGVSFT